MTLQYSKRPSPLSLGKIGDAQEQNRLLWLRILERVRQMAARGAARAWCSSASRSARTRASRRSPAGARWALRRSASTARCGSAHRRAASGATRSSTRTASTSTTSIVAVVNDYEQFLAFGEEGKERKRYVLLSHDNDGVTKFGASLLNRRPTWLGPDRPRVEELPGRSPRGIPSSMRWRPITTFFQPLVDMKNAQLPGSYRAWAHDYRADLPEFIRDVFDLECSDEQLERDQGRRASSARSSARPSSRSRRTTVRG